MHLCPLNCHCKCRRNSCVAVKSTLRSCRLSHQALVAAQNVPSVTGTVPASSAPVSTTAQAPQTSSSIVFGSLNVANATSYRATAFAAASAHGDQPLCVYQASLPIGDLQRLASDPHARSKVLLGADASVTLPEFDFADVSTLDAAVADAYNFTGSELYHASGQVTYMQRMDSSSPWQLAGRVTSGVSSTLAELSDKCVYALPTSLLTNIAARVMPSSSHALTV